MKAKDVLKILKVTRPTLCKYVKDGSVKVKLMPNGDYDYDEDSVLAKAGICTEKRKCAIYARVSTQKQKKSLSNQIQLLTEFSNKNGYSVDKVFSDIASGLSFDRKNFRELLDLIINRHIKTVIIKDKDRLSRISFDMWKDLFKSFNCELIVMNELVSSSSEEKEIFEDIVSLIHCFSMRMYSARRKKKIQIVEEDLKNEISDEYETSD